MANLSAQFATNYDNTGQDQGRRQKWRGLVESGERALEAKNYESAVRFFTAALASNPQPKIAAQIYEARGNAYTKQGARNDARRDYERAVRLAARGTADHAERADLYKKMGDYRAAARELTQQTKISPSDAGSWNDLAWLRATAPASDVRDGKTAVRFATRACELTAWKKAGYLDTLAASYAEAGDFEAAVKYQTQALNTGFHPREEREEYAARLARYRARKPYRQERK